MCVKYCVNRESCFQTRILFLLFVTERACSDYAECISFTISAIHNDGVWQSRSCKSTSKISGNL